MGNSPSTRRCNGSLKGAYPQPTQESSSLATVPTRSFLIKIPSGLSAGRSFTINIAGCKRHLVVPKGKQGGDRMMAEFADEKMVYASTLPTLPGMVIVQAKPIIFGSVSHAYWGGETTEGQQGMGQLVGDLMEQAQEETLHRGIDHGCNAVLGMSYNVTVQMILPENVATARL